MNMDFKRTARKFIVFSLIFVLLGGILTCFIFRTQIGEAVTYYQTYEGRGESERHRERNESYQHDDNYNEYREREHDYMESDQFTKPTSGALIVLLAYAVLCVLIAITYWLLVTSWIYQAASNAAMNRTLWTILAFFFNVAAVIAFLIIRSMQATCPNCASYQKKGDFCRVCGSPLETNCTECGELVDRKDKYCSHCGKKLEHNKKDKTK